MSLDWPAGWDRTPVSERTRNHSFEVTRRDAIRDLEAELDRLGVDDWKLSTNGDHQSDNPNYLYANAPEPDDAGVVVRWTMDGDQFAVGCDRYVRLRDNIRTAGLYIREKRKMEQRPVTTGEAEFSNLQLPAGDDPVAGEAPPHIVLGVEPDADSDDIKEAFRERVMETHPDSDGGDQEAFQRVQNAREVMLDADE